MRYLLAFAALACSGQSYPGISGAISSEPGMYAVQGPGTHSSFDASACIYVTSSPVPRPKVGPPVNAVTLVVVNNCKVKFLVVRVSLKYFDKDGYRIGSDADDAGVLIPGFAVGEKVKKVVRLIDGAVGAELRDVVAIR